jgi:hypothetical protein
MRSIRMERLLSGAHCSRQRVAPSKTGCNGLLPQRHLHGDCVFQTTGGFWTVTCNGYRKPSCGIIVFLPCVIVESGFPGS